MSWRNLVGRIRRFSPNSDHNRLRKLEAAARRGTDAVTLAAAQELLRADPRHAAAMIHIALIRLQAGDAEQGEILLRQSVETAWRVEMPKVEFAASLMLAEELMSRDDVEERAALLERSGEIGKSSYQFGEIKPAVLQAVYRYFGAARLEQGNVEAAIEYFGSCLAIADRILARSPADPLAQRSVVAACGWLVQAALPAGRDDVAGPVSRRALEICEALVARTPDDPVLLWERGCALTAVMTAEMLAGDLEAAAATAARAVADFDAALARRPGETAWRRDRATACSYMARLALEGGEPATAEEAWRRALADTLAIRPEPPDDLAEADLAAAYTLQSEITRALGHATTARDAAATAVAIHRHRMQAAPNRPTPAQDWALAHRALAEAEAVLGKVAAAHADWLSGARELRRLVAAGPDGAAWATLLRDYEAFDPSAMEQAPLGEGQLQPFVRKTARAVQAKNKHLKVEHGIDRSARWRFDTETASLRFVDATGCTVLACDVVEIGSYAREQGTWQWGWSNSSLPLEMRTKAMVLKELAQLTGDQSFVREEIFSVQESETWVFTALAVWKLHALGCYDPTIKDGQLKLVLALMRIRQETTGNDTGATD